MRRGTAPTPTPHRWHHAVAHSYHKRAVVRSPRAPGTTVVPHGVGGAGPRAAPTLRPTSVRHHGVVRMRRGAARVRRGAGTPLVAARHTLSLTPRTSLALPARCVRHTATTPHDGTTVWPPGRQEHTRWGWRGRATTTPDVAMCDHTMLRGHWPSAPVGAHHRCSITHLADAELLGVPNVRTCAGAALDSPRTARSAPAPLADGCGHSG